MLLNALATFPISARLEVAKREFTFAPAAKSYTIFTAPELAAILLAVEFTTELIQAPDREAAVRAPDTVRPVLSIVALLTPEVVIPTAPAPALYTPVLESVFQLKLGFPTESDVSPNT